MPRVRARNQPDGATTVASVAAASEIQVCGCASGEIAEEWAASTVAAIRAPVVRSGMEGSWREDSVVVDGDQARQQLYDARGYGRPLSGESVELAPVEAAHLLYRGDLDAVDGDDLAAFAESCPTAFDARFLAYVDLRERGFYLSPAREGWVPEPSGVDFVVYPRGCGPADGAVEYRLRVLDEGGIVPARGLGEVVLAAVDEDGEVTYLATDRIEPTGDIEVRDWSAEGVLLSDRVIVWEPPASLYEQAFFGQPVTGRELTGPLQLSLVEAAYLAGADRLSVPGGVSAVHERGRQVEGDRFDRRLAVYSALRASGTVPKTGFKFGADFRVYESLDSLESLGHSSMLVRVLPVEYEFSPRELALDVRLAGGVRKQMIFGLAGEKVTWIEVDRITP